MVDVRIRPRPAFQVQPEVAHFVLEVLGILHVLLNLVVVLQRDAIHSVRQFVRFEQNLLEKRRKNF